MRGYSPVENRLIAVARVHVERFFGRMKCAWKILSTKYRRSHKHFDRDFDILVALTNKLILCRPQPTLAEDERYALVHEHLKQQLHIEFARRKARITRADAERTLAEIIGETSEQRDSEISGQRNSETGSDEEEIADEDITSEDETTSGETASENDTAIGE